MTTPVDPKMTCAYPGCGKHAVKAGVLYCGDHVIWPQDPPSSAPEEKPQDQPA